MPILPLKAYLRAVAVLIGLSLLAVGAGQPRLPSAYAQGMPLEALLKAEGEQRQVIQFNPAAALQKRVFADGFVPNSGEFGLEVAGVAYMGQRAENLGNGRVRVYYVAVGDWGTVRSVERGGAGDALGEALIQAGEKAQLIQFNPAAALQARVFRDGFVPNSPEFGLTANGVSYAAQRAENLGSGEVRVYYVVVGEWGAVMVAGQGASGAGGGATRAPVQPLQITFIESRRDLEYIEIRNVGAQDQPLAGFRVYSANGESSTGCGTRRDDQSYTFPSDFVLPAGQRVRVHSGRFAAPVPNTATTLYWAPLYIWYNDGDRGELVAPDGTVVATRSYGWCR